MRARLLSSDLPHTCAYRAQSVSFLGCVGSRTKMGSRGILEAAPSGLYKALWFARRQAFFREEHLQALFPLPLGHGNDAYMLDSLVGLVVAEPTKIKGMVMPLLSAHHPELAQLFSLHLSLFPDASPGQTYAQALVEPYQRLRGTVSHSFDSIEASVFEGP